MTRVFSRRQLVTYALVVCGGIALVAERLAGQTATPAPGGAQAPAMTSITYPVRPGPGSGKRVVFISGDEEYRSEEALPMLAKILAQRHGFTSTVLFSLDPDGTINPKNTQSISNPGALDTADLIVMLVRYRNWPEADLARFERAVHRGVPLIAIRTSTHSFNAIPADSKYARWNQNNNGGFGRMVFGETWVTHWGRHKVEGTRGAIESAQTNHPVLRGVDRLFVESDVYEAHPPADVAVLVRGVVTQTLQPDSPPATTVKVRANDKQSQPVNDPAMPVIWTREYKNEAGTTNRVLVSTMGSATDFENEGLRRLMVNAVYWGLGLNVPARADVTYVDPYRPSFFGFDLFRKGLKVSDFEIGKTVPGEPTPRP